MAVTSGFVFYSMYEVVSVANASHDWHGIVINFA